MKVIFDTRPIRGIPTELKQEFAAAFIAAKMPVVIDRGNEVEVHCGFSQLKKVAEISKKFGIL